MRTYARTGLGGVIYGMGITDGNANIARAHGRFGIYEVKPMKVMPPRKKGKKI